MSNQLTFVLGAGFSIKAGLPLVRDIKNFFVRDNADKLYRASSGEWFWKDYLSKDDSGIPLESFPTSYLLNEFVADYISAKGCFLNYEDFYQYLLDNVEKDDYLKKICAKAEEKMRNSNPEVNYDEEYYSSYLVAFRYPSSSNIISIINHLIADLLIIRRITAEHLKKLYDPFLEYVQQHQNCCYLTLNHDLLLEYLLGDVLGLTYSDGFSKEQSILKSREGNPLKVYNGKFDNDNVVLKLHGSIDIYKYPYYSMRGTLATDTGEYRYFKTMDYYEKQRPQRYTEDGQLIQDVHSEIAPKFITGTRKADIIKADIMYSDLYREFGERLQNSEKLVVIGYSYSDRHINNQIKSAIRNGKMKKIINVNPSIRISNCSYVINLNDINQLNSLL